MANGVWLNTDQQLGFSALSRQAFLFNRTANRFALEVEKQTELAALLHMAEPGKFRQGKCGEKVYIDPIGR